MKILVSGLPHSMGGIGTLVYNMATYNAIAGQGRITFEFLLPADSKYLPILEKDGYTCYKVPPLSHVFAYRARLKEIFTQNPYDYIWINNTGKVDIFCPLLAKKYSGAKVIQHSHGTDMEEHGAKRTLFRLLEKLYGKRYEQLIDIPVACSQASADYFYHDKTLHETCMILPNGIFADRYRFDESRRSAIRERLGLAPETILLGAVGRLTAVKNYSFLVELTAQLPEHFVCVLLGDGVERASLTRQIEELHLTDRVLLVGRQSQVADYLFAMDLFLMPSFNEGMPFSIIEAQAAGLPCLASKGISQETDLTGRVQFLGLESADEWLRACLAFDPMQHDAAARLQGYDLVKQRGFSIEDSYERFVNAVYENA